MANPILNPAFQYASDNQQRALSDLSEFLRIPSISTDSSFQSEMKRAANWIASYLENLGMDEVDIYPEPPTHPVVFAAYTGAGPKAPTVLIYSHYDVQPADPLELWQSTPFEAQIREDRLYARGASDMKGQLFACLLAIESVLKTGSLPVNLKFLLEGMEEIGSRELGSFVQTHKDLLRSDFSLNPDAGMIAENQPGITYGLRGMADFELRLRGPKKDLHSGLYGGAVNNPANQLCKILASLHDEEMRVTLPGFYDKVRPLDEEERKALARLPGSEDFIKAQTGVRQLWGEDEFTPVERTGARPTMDVNGILTGFTGEGTKTIIPATAMAKLSFRLVPDQNPFEVGEALRKYLGETIPDSIDWELIQFSGSYPSISDRNSFPVRAMEAALEETWGVRPLFSRMGGSIPVVAIFQQVLGLESVLTGCSLPEDNVHSPNESLHLPTWEKGVKALIRFFNKFEGQNG